MKACLQIVCALGFGLFAGISEFRSNFTLLFFLVSLGLIYFVMLRYDWPPRLVPWIFACVALGRVSGNWWFHPRRGQLGSVVDTDAWIFVALAVLFFAFELWRLRRVHAERSNSIAKSLSS